MDLVDTHCHLQDAAFDADRDDVIARAAAAGVRVLLTLGTDAASSRAAVALAERERGVWAAAGIHPHDAAEATEADLAQMEALAAHPRVALVGEIGLDFYRNLSPRAAQIAVFERQLETAGRAGKPVAVHTREAQPDMLAILETWSAGMRGRLPDGRPLGVMHYFSSGPAEAARYAELGFLISVHTSVTHPKATLLREVVRETPLGYLVVETDSPYGAPQRHRGKRNEPSWVAEAAEAVAVIKGCGAGPAAEAVTANAMRLLGLDGGVLAESVPGEDA